MKSFLFIILIAFIASKKYKVKPGDTLISIASKHNVKVSDLVSWNKISNPNKINVGLELTVKKKRKGDKTENPENPEPKGKGGKKDKTERPENPEPKVKDGKKDKHKPGKTETPGPKGKKGKPKTYVTEEQMRKMGFKNCNIDDLNRALETYGITTKKRIRHFIAQCALESGLGKYTEEIGNKCKKYDHKKGLGNTKKGDGCKYKGAGYIQLTGKYNYQQFANSIGDDKVMEGVSYVAKNYPWSSAGFWWKNNKMNDLCDRDPSVVAVTKRVNGGTSALSQRQKYYDKACTIF